MKNQINKVISTIILPVFLASVPDYSYAAELTMDARGQVQSVVSLDQVEAQQTVVPVQSSANLFDAGPISAPTVQAAIFHVQVGESIQAAINQAQVGDTVYIHAGTYHESITLKDGVNLVGQDRDTTILDGEAAYTNVILAKGNNRIEGLTVTGGAAYNGAPTSAIRVEGSNVVIAGNNIANNQGYGVYLRSGTNTIIEQNLFTGNHLAIQHANAAVTGTVIRYNTLANNSIGINSLSGSTPRIEYNIITGSTFSAIYEFSWSGYSSGTGMTGYAIVENNTFYNNSWHPAAYGSSTPPAAANQTNGNVTQDPGYLDAVSGNYFVPVNSPAFGRGAYAPIEIVSDPALTQADVTVLTFDPTSEVYLTNDTNRHQVSDPQNIIYSTPTGFGIHVGQNPVGLQGETPAFGGYEFTQALDLSALTELVIGVQADHSPVYVEFRDDVGRRAIVSLQAVVSGQTRYYAINLQDLSSINLAAVKSILALPNYPQTGEVVITLPAHSSLNLTPNTAYSTQHITDLMSTPHGTSGLYGGWRENTANGMTINYDRNDHYAQNGLGGGLLSFSSLDLSQEQELIFSVQGAPASMELHLVDLDGKKFIVQLNGIQPDQETIFALDLTQVTGIDISRIKQIAWIAKIEGTGSFQIQFKPTPNIPVIVGTTYNPAQLTTLPNAPLVGSGSGSAGGANNGTITVTQTSNRHVAMNYSLADNDDFVFSHLGNGYFLNGIWYGSQMSLGNQLTLAANGPAGKQLKVEVKDTLGGIATYYLNLTGSNQNYVLNLSGAGIDPARIVQIIFVADKAHMGSSGQVTIETPGLAYTPVINNPTTAPLTDFSLQRPSASEIEPAPLNTVTSFVQSSANQFSLSYNLPNGGAQRWGAGMIHFQQTFNAQASDIVLDVNLTGASYYKIEVQDSSGKKVVFRVNFRSGKVAITNAMLQSAGVAGFESANIRAIVLVVDEPGATVGQMVVNTRGLDYKPGLTPDTNLTSVNLTLLPGNPQIAVVSASPASATATADFRGVSFDYNTSTVGWAGGGLTFDNFGTVPFEFSDLSGFSDLVLSLQGSSPNVKLEFLDTEGNKAVVYLSGIALEQESIFKIPTSILTQQGVNLSKMRIIYAIIEGQNSQGTMMLRHVPTAPVLPEGWTLVPGQSNLAYRGDNASGVEVINLATGSVSTTPTSQNLVWSTGYRNGIRYVITPEGIKELYYINARSNTNLGVYGLSSNNWGPSSVYVPSFYPGGNNPTPSPDGVYVATFHQLNNITVSSLTGALTSSRIVVPAAEGYGTPYVGQIVFTSDRIAIVTMADGSNRQFDLEIKEDGTAVLLPHVPAGLQQVASAGTTTVFRKALFESAKPVLGQLRYEHRDLVEKATTLIKHKGKKKKAA